ncbi:MAG: hypothetical protein U0570_10880 [Phycisphaerales bacterium]
MFTSKRRLLGGLAASALMLPAPGAITIISMNYTLSGTPIAGGMHTEPVTLAPTPMEIGWSEGVASGSLWLQHGVNFVSGTVRVRANFNYDPPLKQNEQRYIMFTFRLLFSNDEPMTWRTSPVGILQDGQYTLAMMDGTYPVSPDLAPGVHSFEGTSIVGALAGVASNGYADLWFGIPSPAAPLVLLGSALGVFVRRRRP